MRRLHPRQYLGGSLRLLLAQDAHERSAVMVLQHGWIKISRLRPDDMVRKLHHFGRQLHFWNVAEIVLCGAHFVSKPKRHAAKAVAHGFNEKGPLARRQHDTRQPNDPLAAHRISDHREGLLPDFLARHDVIWLLEITRVYLANGKEALYLNVARV